MPASEPFQQLARRFTDPVQHDYEVIRDIMLSDATIAERSRATGLDRDTVGEKARRFVEGGMRGLVDRRTTTAQEHHPYPEVVAGYILYLRQLYPPIHHREIARIIGRKYGYKTNHHTVKAFLERTPIPVQLPLPVTGYHQFDDAYRARWTVVRLFYEGWHRSSIAGLLGLSRQHVWNILQAFERDGFAGLEDRCVCQGKSRPFDTLKVGHVIMGGTRPSAVCCAKSDRHPSTVSRWSPCPAVPRWSHDIRRRSRSACMRARVCARRRSSRQSSQ